MPARKLLISHNQGEVVGDRLKSACFPLLHVSHRAMTQVRRIECTCVVYGYVAVRASNVAHYGEALPTLYHRLCLDSADPLS